MAAAMTKVKWRDNPTTSLMLADAALCYLAGGRVLRDAP